jgi:hypothetical protein
MRMMKTAFWIFLILVNFVPQKLYAYDEEIVHPKINEEAAYQSQLFVKFLDDMGLSGELDKLGKIINDKRVKEWFHQGGTDEDYLTRLLRHFHDPLEPWADAGILELDSI